MIPSNELALAYELRSEGVEWKYIAKGLGWHWQQLQGAVQVAINHGIHGMPTRYPVPLMQLALTLHENGLPWKEVAARLEQPTDFEEVRRLRHACRRCVATGRIKSNPQLAKRVAALKRNKA